jgi:predicted AlkP superfamily pyrophosphatase or phosphodiesterase
MTSLISSLLPPLENHRLTGFSAGPSVIYPHYDRQSLINIPASICHWLGVPTFGAPPLADEILQAMGGPFKHVVMLLVDGLGLQQLQQLIQPSSNKPATGRFSFWSRLLADAVLAPISSVAPSTTASALTSLWTGQPPAVHGIMGYEMYLKEYGLIANMLTHSPASFSGDVNGLRRSGFNPETFLPVPTLGPHLAQSDIATYALQHMAIARSGLSSMLFPAVNVTPFRSPSDLWVTLPALLDKHKDETSYTYIYWGELDELSHRFGPQDRRVELEFTLFSYLLDDCINELRRHARGDTLFLITADHGHLHTPQIVDQETRYHPVFTSSLHMLPSGESRLAYLYARPGHEASLLDYIAQVWPGRFELTSAASALAAGLFGEGSIHPNLAERIGDFILFAQDNAYLWWNAHDNPLLGRHGGLTPTEMIVPLIGLVI